MTALIHVSILRNEGGEAARQIADSSYGKSRGIHMSSNPL